MKRFLVLSAVVLAFAVPAAFAESFGVTLTGDVEIPPGDPNGVGFADLILDGTTLSYSVVVFNIVTPTAIHIHPGGRGETGAPLIPFTTPFVRHEGCPATGEEPCAERFVNVGMVEISADAAADLQANPSAFYLNVHNGEFPGGAVRGQLQFARFLPVVGQTPGAALSNWFTRFGFLNRSMTTTTNWQIEFFPQSPAGNTSRFVSAQDPLGPLNLEFGTTFPVAGFTGIGTARVLSDQPFAVTAAVYNGPFADRGEIGLALQGVALEDAATSGVLIDLTNSSAADLQAQMGHRSNVGFFNPQFIDVSVTFRAFDDEGNVLGERMLTAPPGAMSQFPVFDLINTVAEGDRVQDAFWVSWVASSPILAYATVVNNATGDPEFRD
ncbi:MAG: CHRD domain-containing protein [Thermoanaerobaculia bacterium]